MLAFSEKEKKAGVGGWSLPQRHYNCPILQSLSYGSCVFSRDYEGTVLLLWGHLALN